MSDPSCIFCKIVAGAAPAARVHEDAETLVFMDIMPVAEGHTLVIPKAHHENLYEMPRGRMAAVAETARRVALAMRAALAPDGMRVFQLNGEAAGQTVFHYHMHLLPSTAGQPLQLHGRTLADPEALEALAARIRGGLAG